MNVNDYSVLIKEFSERLPHDLYFSHCGKVHKLKSVELDSKNVLNNKYPIEICYPFLRPMSSMTNDEEETYESFIIGIATDEVGAWELTDWLNKNKFDYRGLIPMSLALEAPKEMYA